MNRLIGYAIWGLKRGWDITKTTWAIVRRFVDTTWEQAWSATRTGRRAIDVGNNANDNLGSSPSALDRSIRQDSTVRYDLTFSTDPNGGGIFFQTQITSNGSITFQQAINSYIEAFEAGMTSSDPYERELVTRLKRAYPRVEWVYADSWSS